MLNGKVGNYYDYLKRKWFICKRLFKIRVVVILLLKKINWNLLNGERNYIWDFVYEDFVLILDNKLRK